MTNAELQAVVINALNAAPKPITDAMPIIAAALEAVSAGKESQEFAKWYERNGTTLMERANAGL